MGRQIFKQPDGLWAEYSTICDGFIITDATAEELIEEAAEEVAETTRKRYRAIIEDIEDTAKVSPYYQFSLTWEEARRNHNRISSPENQIK